MVLKLSDNQLRESDGEEINVYPSPPMSPVVKSEGRKKAVILIQCETATVSEVINRCSRVGELHLSNCPESDYDSNPTSNLHESIQDDSPTYEYDGSTDSSSSSSMCAYSAKNKDRCVRRIRRIKCTKCSRKFLRRDAYKMHQYKKHGLYPFICEDEGCKERFSTLSDLFKHRKVHDLSSCFPCMNCHRVFTSVHSRRVHSRQHLKRRRRTCKQCDLVFNHLTLFQRHIRQVHGIKHGAVSCSKANPKALVVAANGEANSSFNFSADLTGRFRAIMPRPTSKLPLPKADASKSRISRRPRVLTPQPKLKHSTQCGAASQCISTEPVALANPNCSGNNLLVLADATTNTFVANATVEGGQQQVQSTNSTSAFVLNPSISGCTEVALQPDTDQNWAFANAYQVPKDVLITFPSTVGTCTDASHSFVMYAVPTSVGGLGAEVNGFGIEAMVTPSETELLPVASGYFFSTAEQNLALADTPDFFVTEGEPTDNLEEFQPVDSTAEHVSYELHNFADSSPVEIVNLDASPVSNVGISLTEAVPTAYIFDGTSAHLLPTNTGDSSNILTALACDTFTQTVPASTASSSEMAMHIQ